jgi:hypothetical protein
MERAVMMRRFWLAPLLLLGACATTEREKPKPTVEIEEPATGWKSIASDEDVARIEATSAAWNEALAAARGAGFGRQMAKEGALLDPDAGLPRAAPPPGSYLCRVIRMGPSEGKGAAYSAFKPFFCNVGVNDDQLSITKQTGSERPAGYLWEEDGNSRRLIFLGSLALGSEEAPRAYGEDPTRDMAGIFERVAAFRYRLVIPRPRGTSKLDVIELVPAPRQAEE